MVPTKSILDNNRPSRPKNERPSRPLSAYNLFFRGERARMLHEELGFYRSMDFSTLSRYIGQKWRNTADHDKARYRSLAALDKKRYSLELVAFHAEQEEFIQKLQAEEAAQEERASLAGHEAVEHPFEEVDMKQEPPAPGIQAQDAPPFGLPRMMHKGPIVYENNCFDNMTWVDVEEAATMNPVAAVQSPTPIWNQTPTNGNNIFENDSFSPNPIIGFNEQESLKKIAESIGDDGICFLIATFGGGDHRDSHVDTTRG